MISDAGSESCKAAGHERRAVQDFDAGIRFSGLIYRYLPYQRWCMRDSGDPGISKKEAGISGLYKVHLHV